MDITQIVSGIDDEIRRLQQTRVLLLGINGTEYGERRKPGRPKGSVAVPKRTTMSPEGRKRIAEAMRRRWALKKASTAAGKRPAKKPAKAAKAVKAPASGQ